MAKFMVLFKSSLSADELMASATPEQMQASMAEWIQWKDDLDPVIGFEWGMPLQARSEITPDTLQNSQSTISGYAIMSGDIVKVTEVLRSHPHLGRTGASIDILEMLSMPGI